MDFEKVKKCILGRMQQELPKGLNYHKLEHSLDVLEAVERIAKAEGVDSKELILLKTAAIFHDSGFMVQYEQNEPVGCEIACEVLPGFGYNPEEIKSICTMILSTAIPQNPRDHLSEILCDADLDYLGRDDFYRIATDLREELESHGRAFSEQEWIKFEVDFLEKHQYFTETSRKIREPIKQKYIKELKNALAKL